ncbi:Restriction of telomere capping protein 5 [Operophtera brumata]|uniref:Restriction of telomere capping protein 5 n=1 Tax=Operophtera brumata TaxID=104452 RepID=A0A0L7LFL8_OPEBR|nr:Restriction of telomere capping protein 5 [Operophtera brumata]
MERWEKAFEDIKLRIFGVEVKLLVQRSQKEDGVNGVTENSFKKYLFPMYSELATHFFAYIHRAGKCKNHHIPLSAFRQQCERIMSMLDDAVITDTYVSSDEEEGTVTPECLRKLLYTSYKLAMDHYPEGPQTCLLINKTLSAVVNGCFNNKDSHSVGFVVRWLEEHCHRLIHPVHRYCVHTLATRHRDIETHASEDGEGAGLELGTPVLARALGSGSALLPLSCAWLLAAAAPPLYSTPLQPPQYQGGGGLASAAWLSRLVCAVPSHWAPLYISREHGLGANRFLHHTLAYRFCVVERAPKMLYLNTAIRGYAKGLRAGSDARKPLLAVPEGFDTLTFKGVPYALNAIEVWGCGDRASRESQLEVKKWQVREAERQRHVWGCGDRASRESQLEVKKWQVREAERQRHVWGCGDRASRESQLEVKKWQVREAERQRHVWGCADRASRESQLDVKKWQVREAERQRHVSTLYRCGAVETGRRASRSWMSRSGRCGRRRDRDTQSEKATIDKIVDAFIKLQRYDILKSLEDPLCNIAQYFNKDDSGYQSNGKSTGHREIVRLKNMANDLPLALNKNMVIQKKDPEKPKQPMMEPATNKKGPIQNNTPILFLTFAQDGLPTAINIQEYVDSWTDIPEVKVITLNGKRDEIFQNPEKVIREYFEKLREMVSKSQVLFRRYNDSHFIILTRIKGVNCVCSLAVVTRRPPPGTTRY